MTKNGVTGGNSMSGRKTERGIFRVLTMAVCVLASAAVCLNTGISAVRADAADGGRTAVMSEAEETALQGASSGTSMYRLYNKITGEHLYTSSVTERNSLVLADQGWTYEGIGWTAPSSGTPVYRMYNPVSHEHHYTTDRHERSVLLRQYHWNDEGIGWYSDNNSSVAMYRQFNPKSGTAAGSHNYTADVNEKNALVSQYGWQDEGLAWYALTGSVESDANPMTICNGIDFSAVYDYSYVRAMYPSVVSSVGGSDAALIRYFAEKGITDGMKAKATYDQAAYDALRSKVIASRDPMQQKAQSYSSRTNWLILVNQSNYTCEVFTGGQNNWSLARKITVAVGAPSTPTPVGTFTVGIKELVFGGTGYRCWYATQISGNYLFHSTLYSTASSPVAPVDNRVGAAISHGCVRMHLEDAKWIYDNVPGGSKIVIYR